MKVIDVKQGSEEWKKLRSEYFTASEAPAMMGASKYMTRTQLLDQKKTGINEEVTPEKQRLFDRGHAAEAKARPIVEAMISDELFPATGISDCGQYLASFDGIDMLGTMVFEHKLWSESLAEQVRSGELEPHYYWQLEHQLLVSGADRVIFVTSDGTEYNFESMEYRPVEGRRDQLIRGWAQFAEDLKDHQPKAAKPEAVADLQKELPAVRVEVTGDLAINDNFAAFGEALQEFIERRLVTEPKTDLDFANLEAQIKILQKAEKALDDAEARLLEQVTTVDQLKKQKDGYRELARKHRLAAEKLLKAEKENRKREIVQNAKQALSEHIAGLNKNLRGIMLPVSSDDFASAMKGKKKLDSMQSAVDDELARAKIEANEWAEEARANLATLEELADDHRFLFNDLQQIIFQDNSAFARLVKIRVAEHEKAEAERLAAERERIRQEEVRNLEREQRQREEAERNYQAEVDREVEADRAAAEDAQWAQGVEARSHVEADSEETVTITRAEYNHLLCRDAYLSALEAAGVEQWEGYNNLFDYLDQEFEKNIEE